MVDRDGLHAVIQALMQAVGRESLLSAVQQACDLRMGPEPVVVGLAGAQVGLLPTSQASCCLRHDRLDGCAPLAGRAVGGRWVVPCALDGLLCRNSDAHAVAVASGGRRGRGSSSSIHTPGWLVYNKNFWLLY